MVKRDADGDGVGNPGKWRRSATWGSAGQQGNTVIAASVAADESGAQGHHGERPALRGRNRGRQGNVLEKPIVPSAWWNLLPPGTPTRRAYTAT